MAPQQTDSFLLSTLSNHTKYHDAIFTGVFLRCNTSEAHFSDHSKIYRLRGLVENAQLSVVPLVTVHLEQSVNAGYREAGHQLSGGQALELGRE